MYKEKLKEHYKGIYIKYGFEYPTLEYLFMNYEEFYQDIASVQIDSSITELPDIFDQTNAEDMLLKKVIKFYHKIFSMANSYLLFDLGQIELVEKDAKDFESSYTVLMEVSWNGELKEKANEIRTANSRLGE